MQPPAAAEEVTRLQEISSSGFQLCRQAPRTLAVPQKVCSEDSRADFKILKRFVGFVLTLLIIRGILRIILPEFP